ncbi:MAG: hypothetical protein ACKPKO_59155, partial [Candidatus Fonsibacter sp.]
METRTKDTEEFAFLVEARLCSAEQAFYREAEQNEMLADMAKDVSSGTVTRMMRMEDTLQKERADKMSAELQVGFLVRTVEQRMSMLESHAE